MQLRLRDRPLCILEAKMWYPLAILGAIAAAVIALYGVHRSSIKREEALKDFLRNNPGVAIGTGEVMKRFNVGYAAARKYFNALRGDQSNGWGYSSTTVDKYGHPCIIYVAPRQRH